MTDGLNPGIMTPFAEGGALYGVDQPGSSRGEDRDRRAAVESWLPVTQEDSGRAGGSAVRVKNGDRFFLFNDSGG